jgi:hypothetical protein
MPRVGGLSRFCPYHVEQISNNVLHFRAFLNSVGTCHVCRLPRAVPGDKQVAGLPRNIVCGEFFVGYYYPPARRADTAYGVAPSSFLRVSADLGPELRTGTYRPS